MRLTRSGGDGSYVIVFSGFRQRISDAAGLKMSIRRDPRLRRAAIARVLCVGALCAGHLFAAASPEDSKQAKTTELVQLQVLARMMEQSKAAGRQEEAQIVRSMTDKMSAQFPNIPPEKRMAIEAASQRFLSEVDNSFDHYAAALREIVYPEIANPSKAESIQPDRPPLRFSGSDPSAPDGKVVASSVSDRCEAPPSVASPAQHASLSGRSVLCVCVDEKGTLTQAPVITESSGDSRVDSGAVKLARLDSGRYRPPAVDGKPQKGCFRFAINFRHPE
jgi:TonB family protein